MANDLIRSGKHVPALFESLGIESVSTKDTFSLEYAAGLLTATIRRQGGGVEVVRRSVKGGFSEITRFDPDGMSKQERNNLIHTLSAGRMTQSEIARRVGVSQATVNNVLRPK